MFKIIKNQITGSGRRSAGIAAVATGVIGVVLLVSGCSSSSGSSTSESSSASSTPKQIVIGVAMKTQLQQRWAFDVKAMQAEADAMGAKLIVQYANDDATVQATQVENLLSQGINALIIVPVDDKAAAASVSSAKKSKVPVISYDIGVQGVPADAFVIRDNNSVGVLQAKAALQFTGGKGHYALIEGDAANDVAQSIHKNQVATLTGSSVKTVYDQFTKNWDPATALSTAENILSKNNDNIQAFLTANDGMAGGVIQALQGRHLGGKVFVSGLDASAPSLKFIVQGLQTMSVWTPIDKQGKIAVDTAITLAKGEKLTPDMTSDNGSGTPIPTMLVPVQAITKDNVCAFINTIAPKGWVTAKDVYDNPSKCPAP